MDENAGKLTFRNRSEQFLTSNKFAIPFLIVISVLMLVMDNVGQILGFFGILLILWSTRWNWGKFGWLKKLDKDTFLKALFYTIVLIVVVDIILTPLIESISNTPVNLENFEGLRGNFISLLISIVLMWIIAGIGEELLFRGFMMKKLADLFGDNTKSWLLAAFLSSIIFGFAHTYQGITGIITTVVFSLIISIAFIRNKENLLICILVHGFYDTFGLTMIYLGQETIISEFMQQYIFLF